MCRWAGNGRLPADGVRRGLLRRGLLRRGLLRRGLLRRGCEGSRCSGSASAAVLYLPGDTPFPGRFRRRGVAIAAWTEGGQGFAAVGPDMDAVAALIRVGGPYPASFSPATSFAAR